MCNEKQNIAVKTNYGIEYTAGFISDNIIGMQFHPEKSHKYGMQLLKNFIEHY